MRDAPVIQVHRSFRRAVALFNEDRFRWLDEAVLLGPLAAIRLGPLTIWVVTDAGIARQVLLTEETGWIRPSYFTNPTRQAIGDNLFTLSEEQWQAINPALAPHFRSASFSSRLSQAESMVTEDIASWSKGALIDLDLATSRLVLRCAALLLLGDELTIERANELVVHQRALMAWLGERISTPSAALPFRLGTGRDMKAHRGVFDGYVREVIARRRNKPGEDDALGALLAARPGGLPMTEVELCSHIAGLIGAGNEVTAATLSWALVYAAQSPETFDSVKTSVEAARRFVMETVRLSSCAWSVTRRPRRTTHLVADGVRAKVRRTSAVLVYLRGMNRNAACWENPTQFDPDRHATADKEQQRLFIPFGLGHRGCAGQQLAMIELTTTLRIIAQSGRVTVEGDVAEDAQFATRVRGGLRGALT
jgi:cytochrome P450